MPSLAAALVQAQGSDVLTANQGAPVADNTNSLTAGPRGPVLLQDYRLLEKLAQFEREQIPERIVHARGAAAFGTFEATADLSDITDMKMFSEAGKETPVQVRPRTATAVGTFGSPLSWHTTLHSSHAFARASTATAPLRDRLCTRPLTDRRLAR